MYRRSALGSARFYAPHSSTTTTTTLHRGVSTLDNHPDFEMVGLDNQALTQVRISLNTWADGKTLIVPRDHPYS